MKVVVPSGPRNARALLAAAVADPDPVVFLEPKASYRTFREEVPNDAEKKEIGNAEVVRKGDALTIVAYGAMLPRAQEAADELEKRGVDAEIVDVLTLAPLDYPTIVESVSKSGRCVVVHEAPLTYGPGAEIAARIMEEAFLTLKAPVARVAGPDVHMPYFAREQSYLPDSERIANACLRALDY